ncbi:MAG: hypothetical protein BEN19_07375 [Epulopiscium sp. Nuni2H_MBin003]|nr:MAG: hypothetical protein BEN19_07375 [Epulopiscium sp. Nuni2H_MBin003]
MIEWPEEKDQINKILALIKERKGIDFVDYKRSTIIRRIKRRMDMLEMGNILEYINYIEEFIDEIDTLHNEIFIGVTSFFRDKEAFRALGENVIPKLFNDKLAGMGVRIWSAGCSTGEEAYSLAILFSEYLETTKEQYTVKIFATDINDIALAKASAGVYTIESLKDVSQERLDKYFDKKGNYYQVKKHIREMIIFAKHNIISHPPFSKLDLIVCRNLLIYLENSVQKYVFSAFDFSLNSNGYLFLGSSESLGEISENYKPFDFKSKIFRRVVESSSRSKKVVDRDFGTLDSKYTSISKNLNANSVDRSVEKIIQSLQNEYIPKGVIVNETYDLIHSFGDVNEFVRIPTNRISLNLLKMIRKDLSVAVGTALQNVFVSGKEIKYNNINANESGKGIINLIVKLYVDEISNTRYGILLFEENKERPTYNLHTQEFNLQEKSYERIEDLENELKSNREYLQALIEELESSNEELQSMNEELVSSNEELQNTNEELQSVNEEIYTLNTSYNKKIEELTEVNEDINTILALSDVILILIDEHLKIRRFTPGATKVINLIKNDIGRDLADIAIKVKYDNLIEDIKTVAKTLKSIKRTVLADNDTKYQFNINVYKNKNDSLKQIVINVVEEM